MSKTRIRAVWGTAQSEYIKWICSSRMLIFLCALIFIDQFAVKPLVEISKQTGVKLGLFEPFIAITNSDVLLMIMPIVFITLIGDFPKNDGNMLFCVQHGVLIGCLGKCFFLLCLHLHLCLELYSARFLRRQVICNGANNGRQQSQITAGSFPRTPIALLQILFLKIFTTNMYRCGRQAILRC